MSIENNGVSWKPGDPIPEDMRDFHFVSWITSSIAVSSFAVAQDLEVLEEEHIDSVVSLGGLHLIDGGGRRLEWIRKFYDAEEAVDIRDSTIERAVDVVLKLSVEGKVLVHCAAGVSRSPGVVMLSLCFRDGMSWNDAKRFVVQKRSVANVHPVLERRLIRWLDADR